jgi:hypothetical protein
MIELNGQPAELTFTVTVTRKNGDVETFNMIGKIMPPEEPSDGSNALDSSAERSD